MKLAGIFVLTPREQRAAIVIMLALLAAAVAKQYHDHWTHFVPAPSPPAETSATPSIESAEEESREPGE